MQRAVMQWSFLTEETKELKNMVGLAILICRQVMVGVGGKLQEVFCFKVRFELQQQTT